MDGYLKRRAADFRNIAASAKTADDQALALELAQGFERRRIALNYTLREQPMRLALAAGFQAV